MNRNFAAIAQRGSQIFAALPRTEFEAFLFALLPAHIADLDSRHRQLMVGIL